MSFFFTLNQQKLIKKTMVKRIQTDIYLKEFDSLTEALYLCWHNSFCFATKQLNKEILNEQICS